MSERARVALMLVVIVGLAAVMTWVRNRHDLDGSPAPPIEAPVIAGPGAREGARLDLDDLRGKVVLVDFWASWCPPCRASIPKLNRIHERYADRGLVAYGVNVEEELSPQRVALAHRALGASFPTVHDHDRRIREDYRVEGLPTLFVIDTSGDVVSVHVGEPHEERLAALVEGLLPD